MRDQMKDMLCVPEIKLQIFFFLNQKIIFQIHPELISNSHYITITLTESFQHEKFI